MRTITRYALFEVLKIFLVSLFLLTTLFIIYVVFREAKDRGLDPRQVVRILPYALPEALRFTVPATILFAVSSVYGRMSGSNEVVALKSLGISPMVVLWPVFWLAAALSLSTVLLNDVAVSWGKDNIRRVVVESIEEIAYSMLRANHSFNTPLFSIIVKRVDGRRLIEPTITVQSRGQGGPTITLTAAEAELRANTKDNLLSIICRRGTLHVEGQTRYWFDDSFEHSVPLDAAGPDGDMEIPPSQLPMSLLPQRTREREQLIAHSQQTRAAREAFSLMTGDFAALSDGDAQYAAHELFLNRCKLYRLYTEPHRRWSNGFSCLCFVLIGAPLAIYWRNADVMTSFFACFFPVIVIYYPLLALGVEQSKNGTLPPISVWLGNVVLGLMGLFILRRVIRY
ncbi:MAG: LptF/LptG family permease [Planctomycetes bacterium]|nr:LptF/LptG family permease [Planctomycetota bacterium]